MHAFLYRSLNGVASWSIVKTSKCILLILKKPWSFLKMVLAQEELESTARMWLVDHYSNSVQSFSMLQKECNQCKSESHLSSFPSNGELDSSWFQIKKTIATLKVWNIIKFELCVPITRRWVTYTSSKYYQSSRISSSYIALKNSSDNIPWFGRIKSFCIHLKAKLL